MVDQTKLPMMTVFRTSMDCRGTDPVKASDPFMQTMAFHGSRRLSSNRTRRRCKFAMDDQTWVKPVEAGLTSSDPAGREADAENNNP